MCEQYVKKLIFQREVRKILCASMFNIHIVFVEITFNIITAYLCNSWPFIWKVYRFYTKHVRPNERKIRVTCTCTSHVYISHNK